jgi:competence protein ComEC
MSDHIRFDTRSYNSMSYTGILARKGACSIAMNKKFKERRAIQKMGNKIVALTMALVLTACTNAAEPGKQSGENLPLSNQEEIVQAPASGVNEEESSAFSLTMLDVSQGLSVLVQADGEYMLYDGGSRSASSYVVAYLQQHDVTELTWLVASHYDEDHISGLVGVLKTAQVDQALMPDYTADTQVYESLQNALKEKSVPVTYPTQGETFDLGRAKIHIVGPQTYSYDADNSNSICMRITYGNFSCLLTGDAEKDAECDMVDSRQDLSCDLYVVGHHGSSTSSSEELLDAAAPCYAFLSVGTENSYGHPAEKTMSTLQQHGVKLYRTDKQGEVTVYSNGEQCWFSTSPCEDWTPGTQTVLDRSPVTSSLENPQYVLNIHTKKFHNPDCPSVEQMSDRNKELTAASREELIAWGYTACGRCKP